MISVNIDSKVRMRDGVALSTDIYRPSGAGPFPALLLRTIYDNQEPVYIEWTRRFVEAGYAVVMQDCRGRFDSEGPWEPYVHEAEDGYDTQQWIGAQPWCDGNIGTFGISYRRIHPDPPRAAPQPLRQGARPHRVSAGQLRPSSTPNGALHLHVITQLRHHLDRQDGLQTESRFDLLDWDMEINRRLPLISALDEIADIPWYRDDNQPLRPTTTSGSSYGLRDKLRPGGHARLLHHRLVRRRWCTRASSQYARLEEQSDVGPRRQADARASWSDPWTHYGGIGTAERCTATIDFGQARRRSTSSTSSCAGTTSRLKRHRQRHRR